MIVYVGISMITLFISAFFSGMEMAFVSSSLFQIEIEKKKDSFYSKMLSISIKNPNKFITTMLIGNTISLVIYSIYMGKLLCAFFSNGTFNNPVWIFFSETILSAIIILIVGEYIPKVIGRMYSNELLRFFIVPVHIIYVILSPITNFIIIISNIFLKVLGYKEKNQKKFFDKEDLVCFLSENMKNNIQKKGSVEYKLEIFHKALEFSEKKARECMVPRKEIISYDIISSSIDDIRNIFIKSGLSKVVIYNKNIDHIIGYIHYLEILKKPKQIESIIIPVELVHDTTPVIEIMDILMKKKKSIAIVLDEYGLTSGLITIEDILEEFIGDIKDEHDEIYLLDRKINHNEFLFSARLKIDLLNNKYNLNISKSEKYETLGGLIVTHIGNIPKCGDQIVIDEKFFIEIKKVSKNKIEEVFFRRKN